MARCTEAKISRMRLQILPVNIKQEPLECHPSFQRSSCSKNFEDANRLAEHQEIHLGNYFENQIQQSKVPMSSLQQHSLHQYCPLSCFIQEQEGPKSMEMSMSCPWTSLYFSVAKFISRKIHGKLSRTCCHFHGCPCTFDTSHRLGLLTVEFASYSLNVEVACDVCRLC